MKKFKISLVLEGDLEDEKHAADTVQALIEGTYPPDREVDGGIAASSIEAEELGRSAVDHQANIYKLVQSTLIFCGNTLGAVLDYCRENNLLWRDYEEVRFKATMDFNEKMEVKK